MAAEKLPKSRKNDTLAQLKPSTSPLSPTQLGEEARRATEEILIAGESENTRRTYRSAMRYWCAWVRARYGKPLTLPVTAPMVVQFIVDHTGRLKAGELIIELPAAVDGQLVEAGFKASMGPLKMATITNRLYVLSKLHQLRRQPNPCEDPDVRNLLGRAKRAAAKRGETPTKKTAATREPLEAMLATCDDTLEGVRDRALLLFAWSSGGRRRSEVSAATMDQLRKIDDQTYLFRLDRSKTNQSGGHGRAARPDKPIRGIAAIALGSWIARAEITDGPIFRRLWKGRPGHGLSPASIGLIVKRRASKAGLEGDWAGHSLRSGFVTEAGRRKVPLGDIMAMTEHRQAATVMGYYRSGELFESEVAKLLE